MLTGGRYDSDGRLVDDTGHSWMHVSSWVEPVDAEAAVQAGCRFLVQPCLEPPTRGRAERFTRDILPLVLTRQAGAAFAAKSSVASVFIAEQW
jgi:2-keto-3-deoxy-6-phosphogluconate aldolase